MTALTVGDVLSAPAVYGHSVEIRAVGPAIVLTLEREAPLRIDTLASTESEFAALREWVASSERARHILGAFFDAKDAEDGSRLGHTRADEHSERLNRARKITSRD